MLAENEHGERIVLVALLNIHCQPAQKWVNGGRNRNSRSLVDGSSGHGLEKDPHQDYSFRIKADWNYTEKPKRPLHI